MSFKDFLIKKCGKTQAANFPSYFSREEVHQLAEDYANEIEKSTLLGFWVQGMEAVDCDDCGKKGTGYRFNEAYSNYFLNKK